MRRLYNFVSKVNCLCRQSMLYIYINTFSFMMLPCLAVTVTLPNLNEQLSDLASSAEELTGEGVLERVICVCFLTGNKTEVNVVGDFQVI